MDVMRPVGDERTWLIFHHIGPLSPETSLHYLTMGVEESVYLAKLAEQAERYEGMSFRTGEMMRHG